MKNRIDHSVNSSVFELEAAEREIMKHVQRSSFGHRFMHILSDMENYENNINGMHTTKDIKKELQLITNLKPYIDAKGNGVYGRLDESNFPFQVHHPMILPKRHAYTEHVISDVHRKKQHSGP